MRQVDDRIWKVICDQEESEKKYQASGSHKELPPLPPRKRGGPDRQVPFESGSLRFYSSRNLSQHDLSGLHANTRGFLLKQERVAPLSPEQQLAGLVAYNEGPFNALGGAAVQARLARLLHNAATGGPGLAAGRDAWREAVAGWLREAGDEPPA